MADSVVSLNADAQSARFGYAALDVAIRAQGPAFEEALLTGHDHLFAGTALFVTSAQVEQMQAVIAAVERVVKLPGWMDAEALPHSQLYPRRERGGLGVFYGYDFHLNEQGAHLIEINTNAGGGFLNALLIGSQRDAALPGKVVSVTNLEQTFLAMFCNEWRLERGDAPLKTVCIVDEQPEAQYLYPEFLLAQAMFERAGIAAHIADPALLLVRDDGLYLDGSKIDLVYNRLTDFSLHQHPALRQAYLFGHVVLTPAPEHYFRYADKRNLARLSDAPGLRAIGASEADIAVLQAGVPHTIAVRPEMEETLWAERKNLFFKPNTGYGSKGAYRGEKLTKRVFGEILQSDYVAQNLAAPGERMVSTEEGGAQALKYDVRCYVYDGQMRLLAARLYQGQTTNFRTPGGGFALVREVG